MKRLIGVAPANICKVYGRQLLESEIDLTAVNEIYKEEQYVIAKTDGVHIQRKQIV